MFSVEKHASGRLRHSRTGASGDENEKKGEREYCICLGKDEGYMIGCDAGCESWFHGDCIGLKREDEVFLSSYACPNCSRSTLGQIRWKEHAALEEAQRASDKMAQQKSTADSANTTTARNRKDREILARCTTLPRTIPKNEDVKFKPERKAVSKGTYIALSSIPRMALQSENNNKRLSVTSDINDVDAVTDSTTFVTKPNSSITRFSPATARSNSPVQDRCTSQISPAKTYIKEQAAGGGKSMGKQNGQDDYDADGDFVYKMVRQALTADLVKK